MDILQKYREISEELGLDMDKDKEAAQLLNSLLPKKEKGEDETRLERAIKGRYVFVYGAGPTLKQDIKAIKAAYLHQEKKYVAIAADGAGKALMEEGIVPEIHVTDLDGYPDNILAANNKGAITVVHAHGDNIKQLKEIVPKLKNAIGTTQLAPFGKLHNFGGFTDGDRGVFLAEHFNAGLIILAGMNFEGEIGEYSGTYQREKKFKKLAIAKRLIEELAGESDIQMLDISSGDQYLPNIAKASAQDLKGV
jgi:2-amino-4-hydroxy-6-hydroxymethyldihydropteridine diphosphokinase